MEDRYFNFKQLQAEWSNNVDSSDFIYVKKGSDSVFYRERDKREIKFSQSVVNPYYGFINVTDFSNEKIEQLFRLVRASGVSLLPLNFDDSIVFLDFFEGKGKGYSHLSQISALGLVNEYIKSGTEDDFNNIVKAFKLKETHNIGSILGYGPQLSAYESVDIISEISAKLADFAGIQKFCGELLASAKQVVIGQDASIKDLIIKLVTYIKDESSQGSPILVTGSTGCGKTYSIKTLAKLIGLPFTEISTPELTPEGYVGKNISTVLFNAVIEKVQEFGAYPNRLIIYLDEFGKILQRGSSSDNFTREIQNQFLKLLEPGAKLSVSLGSSAVKELPFRAMVILSDAFSFIKRDHGEDPLTRNDLVEAGFIPELAGRIQLVSPFKTLGSSEFEQILIRGQQSVLKLQERQCTNMGLNLVFEPDSIRLIAQLAEKDGAGGRSLNHLVGTLVEKELGKRIFPNDSKDKVSTMIKINEAVVRKHFPENGKVRTGGFGFLAHQKI